MASQEKNMSILQVLPSLNEGGVERGCVDIAIELKKRGFKSYVASEGGRFLVNLNRERVVHFTLPLSTKNPLKIWMNSYRLSRLIKKHSIQIVHARSRAPAWSAWLACRRTKAIFLTTYHAAYKASGFWFLFKKWYNKIMTKGPFIIAVSDYIAFHIKSSYPKVFSKVKVIHRGVDCEIFNPEKVSAERMIHLAKTWNIVEEKSPVIMFPSRPSRRKGHKILLAALEEIKALNFMCLVVGGNREVYIKKLEQEAEKRGLLGKIRFVGACQDMPAAYMLSDVVVHCAPHPEAFGRVVAEAQAMGRPVIGTRLGGVPEIIERGETGWLTEAGNSHELALALEKAIGLSPEQRHQMAQKSRQRILEFFDKNKMIEKTLGIYKQVLKKEKDL